MAANDVPFTIKAEHVILIDSQLRRGRCWAYSDMGLVHARNDSDRVGCGADEILLDSSFPPSGWTYPDKYLVTSKIISNCVSVLSAQPPVSDLVAVLERESKAGNVHALCNLAFCKLFGVGTQRDEVQALALYRQAEEKGSLVASNNIAVFYL